MTDSITFTHQPLPEQDFQIVSFELGESLEPGDLRELDPPEVDATRGVVLSGRGPIWLYAALVHHYHPTRWVATFDPRLDAAVVVQSHQKGIDAGELVQLPQQAD